MSPTSFLVVLNYAVSSHYDRVEGGGSERGIAIASIFPALPMMSSLMQKGRLADLSRELSTSGDIEAVIRYGIHS